MVQITRPGLEPGMQVPKTCVLPITPSGIDKRQRQKLLKALILLSKRQIYASMIAFDTFIHIYCISLQGMSSLTTYQIGRGRAQCSGCPYPEV